ncbi:hypothetical protein ACFFHM_17390 [Halalkalibacter kiskunsagensis]|uniref:Uncharacterized protein n=1 Tax=Halalkalibacter kiskunsagensis TaxID=1548599 RepID=A0ABV6KG00_9BACI
MNAFLYVQQSAKRIFKHPLTDEKIVLTYQMTERNPTMTQTSTMSWIVSFRRKEELSTVDTILMRRKTYDWVTKHVDEGIPISRKRLLCISRTVAEDQNDGKFVNCDIVNFTNELKNHDGRNIWMVGG